MMIHHAAMITILCQVPSNVRPYTDSSKGTNQLHIAIVLLPTGPSSSLKSDCVMRMRRSKSSVTRSFPAGMSNVRCGLSFDHDEHQFDLCGAYFFYNLIVDIFFSILFTIPFRFFLPCVCLLDILCNTSLLPYKRPQQDKIKLKPYFEKRHSIANWVSSG